jgi:hypothetical protein
MSLSLAGFTRAALFAVLTLAPIEAAAQDDRPYEPGNTIFRSVGFLIGGNAATAVPSDGRVKPIAAGLLGGAFVTGPPNTVSWQAEVLFHRVNAPFANAVYQVSQLEVPVMLRVNLMPDRVVAFHLLAGLSGAWQIKSTIKVNGGVVHADNGGVSATVVVGAGIDVRRFVFGARAFQELTTSFEANGVERRYRAVVVLLGYKL